MEYHFFSFGSIYTTVFNHLNDFIKKTKYLKKINQRLQEQNDGVISTF